MMVTLDDKVMKGYLISLDFHKPKSSELVSTNDVHKQLLDEHTSSKGEYKTTRDYYEPNKKKISLVRDRTYWGQEVIVETLIFSREETNAEITYVTPNMLYERKKEVISHSNQEELEVSIEKALSKLPKEAKIQKHLDTVYQQLLGYVQTIPRAVNPSYK